MLKFSFPLPEFVVRWLFPGLFERAAIHGKASASKRSRRGIFEITATVVEGE